jgi:ATP-binding protein involved in chromosome partitioning
VIDVYQPHGIHDRAVLGEVPLDLSIRLNSDAGTPIVVADPAGPHARVYREIPRLVWEGVERERAGGRPAPRIVIED